MGIKSKQSEPDNRKQFSLTISWAVSYVIILIIPIIICSFYGIHTYRTSKKLDLVYLRSIVAQKAYTFDNSLTEALSCTSTLYLDTNVTKTAYLTVDTISGSDRLYFNNIRSSLASIIALSNTFQNINIYFPQIKEVVNNSTLYSTDLAPYMENSLDKDLLNEMQDGLKQGTGFYITLHPKSGEILLAQAIRTNSSGDMTAIVIYSLDADFFSNHLLSDVDNTYITLTDGSQLLLHDPDAPSSLLTDASALLSELAETPENIYPREYVTAQGEKYVLTVWNSTFSGLRYVALTQNSRYDHTYFSLIITFVFTMFASILVGVVFTIYFIKKNYAPIQKIMEHLEPLPPEAKSTNEYGIILNSIINSSSELQKQRALLSNNYLQKLLSGEITYDSSFPYKSWLQLDVAGSRFFVSVIRIINDDADDHSLYTFIIENVLQELLNTLGYHVIFCSFSDSVACIISYNEEKEEADNEILSCHCTLSEFCRKNYDFILNVGLSDAWQEKKSLSHAYAQAKETLEYIQFYACDPVRPFSSIPDMNHLSSLIIYNTKHMTDLVLNGNRPELEKFFDSLSEKFQTQSITLVEGKNILYYYYQLLTQLQLLLHKRYPAVNFQALDNLDNRFLHLPIAEATQMTRDCFLEACEFIEAHKDNSGQLLITHVCHYIDNNYFNENLNQTTIADHFHMTPAYLAQKFKNEKDVTIIQYLYNVRIQHAKELLKQNKLKISEIATVVGFPNSNSFIRVFKQYTGMTPGKYYEEQS